MSKESAAAALLLLLVLLALGALAPAVAEVQHTLNAYEVGP